MKLSKIIPARRKTVKFNWVYKNFTQFNEQYEGIRKRYGRGSMCRCDWCLRPFEHGEWFAIGQPLPKQEGPSRNWALCHTCADLMNAPSRPKNENLEQYHKS